MLDIRKLKELVRLMVNNDLTELDLRDSEEQVTLRRHGPGGAPQVVTAPAAITSSAPVAAAPTGATAVAEAPDPDLPTIDSPMVGTFYAAPNPDSPPFVSVGSSVDAETVVCLVEAMKIFNEIKAERSGTIEKALVSNGESVEFGQPLFKVRPS
ncbi:MAG: acetyl-CoA carboxylase biotin carboxyl carrier protein [Planctomycetota bacterium]|jgi:acetyl-CoA carboxylase biotin carboxyl carrier protein